MSQWPSTKSRRVLAAIHDLISVLKRLRTNWSPRQYIFLSTVVTFTAFGCGTSTTTQTATNPKQVSSTSQLADPPVAAAPALIATVSDDQSLTAEEYIDLGMPAHERPWSSVDMANAAKVLTEIANRDPIQLPRYHGSKSGELFSRLTSTENFGFFQNQSLPLKIRTLSCVQYMQAANAVSKAYLSGLLHRKTGVDEMTELTGHILRGTVIMVGLLVAAEKALDKNDPIYSTLLNDYRQARAGMGFTLQGVIIQVSEPKTWEAATLGRLIGYMEETFPNILRILPKNVQAETSKQLRRMSDNPDFSEHKASLESMLDKISKAEEMPANQGVK